MKTQLPLILAALALPTLAMPGCAGDPAGYVIRAGITGCMPADSLILARYEGSKTIPVDTLPCAPGGTLFTGEKSLKPGMYAIFTGDHGKIDFLVSDTVNQSFTLSANAGNLLSTLSFEGSPENTAFMGYLRMISHQSDLRQRLSRNAGIPDSVFRLEPEVSRLRKEIPLRSAELQKQFPGTLLALFLQTAGDPKVPQPVVPLMVKDKNRYIQEFFLRNLKEHFWDDTGFSDPRLASLPVYGDKLHYYFQQVVEPVPEIQEPAVEKLLTLAEANPDVLRFTVKSLFHLFRESPYPALIPVSVSIAENYVTGRPELWKGDSFLDYAREKVTKSKLNAVGSVATDLKLVRNTGEILRLSEVNARLTILYFFNPECEACNPITDQLLPIFRRHRDQGVQVFAVYLERKKEVWEKYISSKDLDWINVFDPSGEEKTESKYDIFALPMIYLLDKDKKVMARDVQVENLESLL